MRLGLSILGAAGLALLVPLWWLDASSRQAPERDTFSAMVRLQLQGAGSCASASCHNADSGTAFRGREYALALERDGTRVKDRHAQAYAVLFDARSVKIEQNLRRLDSAQEAHPENNVLCLRCHVVPGIERRTSRVADGLRQFRLEDGVSCEACHGPAEHWLSEHFQPAWTTLSSPERRARGMMDMRAMEERVHLCIDCHVGAPGMDVNHDLIAAGHPRLNFEFSSFHFLLHKHWDHAADLRRSPDFETRGWALGQLAAATASLELLADRAASAGRGPWPEFGEYDCYACHHDLKAQPRPTAERPLAILRWNDWYYAQLRSALAILDPGKDAEVAASLGRLRTEMETNRPRPEQAATEARRAASILRAALDHAETATPALPAAELVRRASADNTQSWDSAAQTYLALAALGRGGQPLAGVVEPLRQPLRFPDCYDSPRDFDAAVFQKRLQALRDRQSR